MSPLNKNRTSYSRFNMNKSAAFARGLLVAFMSWTQCGVAFGEAIPLGNLFDDAKGTAIDAAVATDTYGAIADVGDLGVFRVYRDLTSPIEIGAGVDFNFASAGGGSLWADPIMNDASVATGSPPDEWPIRTSGQALPWRPGPKIEDGIGMHANNAFTFDLDELRTAGGFPSGAIARFSALGAVNDTANTEAEFRLAAIVVGTGSPIAYVNGVSYGTVFRNGAWELDESDSLPFFSGPENRRAAFEIDFTNGDRFLTLASLSMGSHSWDHAVFADAQLIVSHVEVEGDANDDGSVDLEDLNLVRNNFGSSGENVPGDVDRNGQVTLVDLNAVRNHFGEGSSSAVPEPAALLLLAIGAAAVVVTRWRKSVMARVVVTLVFVSGFTATFTSPARGDLAVQWTWQIGMSQGSRVRDLAVDDQGGVLAHWEGFRRYDSAGNQVWELDIEDKYPQGVAWSGHDDIYVTGGFLTPAEDFFAFLSRYSDDGELLWTREFGVVPGGSQGLRPAIDASRNVYVTGQTSGNLVGPNGGTNDIFVKKYNAAGDELWARQLGSSESEWAIFNGVDAAGNLYFGGNSSVPLTTDHDFFLGKMDPDGTLQWMFQSGDATQESPTAKALVVDDTGNNYLVYHTENLGELFAPGYLNKYDTNGELLWSRGLGPRTGFTDAFLDSQGNILLAGAAVDGPMVDKFDAAGNLIWSQRYSAPEDTINALAVDRLGNIFMGVRSDRQVAGIHEYDYWITSLREVAPGDTNGDGLVDLADLNNVRNNFGGTGLGDTNADGIVDLDDLNAVRDNFGASNSSAVPEPSALFLLAGGLLALGAWRGSALIRLAIRNSKSPGTTFM